MTFIVGMTNSNEVVMAADGLVTQYRPDNPAHTVRTIRNKLKLFQLSNYIVVGFAGNSIHSLDSLISILKQRLREASPSSVREASRIIATYTYAFYSSQLRTGAGIEIMVGGFDLDLQGNPAEPRLYYSDSSNLGLYRMEFVTAGFFLSVVDNLRGRYDSSSKSFRELRQIAIDTVEASANNHQGEVGGITRVFRITRSGIQKERVN